MRSRLSSLGSVCAIAVLLAVNASGLCCALTCRASAKAAWLDGMPSCHEMTMTDASASIASASTCRAPQTLEIATSIPSASVDLAAPTLVTNVSLLRPAGRAAVSSHGSYGSLAPPLCAILRI